MTCPYVHNIILSFHFMLILACTREVHPWVQLAEDLRPSSELRNIALRIVRDFGDYNTHRWPAWAALYRVGYNNGIYCTLSFNAPLV